MRVVLISLEPWDGVWRRNQYLVREPVEQRLVEQVVFVQPPERRPTLALADVPDGVEIVAPGLRVPKRLGGLRFAASDLRSAVARADLLWVNDPSFGVHALRRGLPAVYDVTDDWREFSFPSRIVRRIVRAENRLAGRARTVVCSDVLRRRWQTRYGVQAALVPNGIDERIWATAAARVIDGRAPHVGYIGTLHADRLDLDLVLALARHPGIGTVHLVGPDALDPQSRALLAAEPTIVLHGPVPAVDVPSWSMAMDVLVCPHRISDFTLSLDAIKAREYLVSNRPVVATATSGFQALAHPNLRVEPAKTFASTVVMAATLSGRRPRVRANVQPEWTWASRARAFHDELRAAVTA